MRLTRLPELPDSILAPVIAVVAMPVHPRAAIVAVMAPVAMVFVVMVPSIVPLPVTMSLLPFPALPIAMPVVIPFAVPTWTDDDRRGRFGIYRRRSINRLRRICRAGNTNVDSDVDMRECDGRHTNSKAGDCVIANRRLRKMAMISVVCNVGLNNRMCAN